VVEGARLESEYTVKGIKGSNPFLSAKTLYNPVIKFFFIFEYIFREMNFINFNWDKDILSTKNIFIIFNNILYIFKEILYSLN
jgi:hypothetical protein